MTTTQAAYRATRFSRVDVVRSDRADGTTLLRSAHPLGETPARFTDRLMYWADLAPHRVCVAQRDTGGAWRKLSYTQVLEQVRNIGQALLDAGLSAERTLIILSENSIEHFLLSMAALHVGVPYAPISPLYSLASQDFGKLRHCLQLMTPGMVFASEGTKYARALELVAKECASAKITSNDEVTRWASTRTVGGAVDATHARITRETVAKVLFTSGSTSMPKGVINTHGMWCANLAQITLLFPFMDEPPVLVDWLPWNHTFGGNHNIGLTIHNGGSLYIDDGRPTAEGIAQTARNLCEIAPTVYFNVPKGFEELVPYLARDAELRKTFFSRLQMMFYAGASLAQPIWNALDALAVQSTGQRVPMITGLGMTESGPSAIFANWTGAYSGLLGCPISGIELKLVPMADKTEVRYRGPNITPGYWRQPDLTAASFDEEGFFRTGDAVKFVDEHDPNKGLLFDGRIAEDFKLNTGTWVSVGVLRGRFAAAGAPVVQDSVITGLDRSFVGALVFLNMAGCRQMIGDPTLADAQVMQHAQVRDAIHSAMRALAKSGAGSASVIRRALIAEAPLSIDAGEVTDKGSLNQRTILKHRAALVEELHGDTPSARTICL